MVWFLEAQVSGAVPEDPKDNTVLACALDGRTDLVLNGDRHLLGLGECWGILIPHRPPASGATGRRVKGMMDSPSPCSGLISYLLQIQDLRYLELGRDHAVALDIHHRACPYGRWKVAHAAVQLGEEGDGTEV